MPSSASGKRVPPSFRPNVAPVIGQKRAAPSTTPASSSDAQQGSKKRKTKADTMKFYAVRVGKRPGVYLTWKECQDHTAGFKGAVCK